MNKYFTILPATVRYDMKLSPNAKILYSELLGLSGEKGFCWATNGYFATLFGVDKATISRWISALHKRGYIFFEPIDKKVNTLDEIVKEYRQIYIAPLDDFVNHNNNNIYIINNKRKKTKQKDISPTYNIQEFEEYINTK